MQVHDFNSEVFGVIGEGKVMVPTIPVYLFSSSFPSPVNVVFRVRVIVSVDTLDGTLEGETHKIGPGTHRRCAWVRDGACIGGYSLVAVLIDVLRGVL